MQEGVSDGFVSEPLRAGSTASMVGRDRSCQPFDFDAVRCAGEATDPATFVFVAVILVVIALLATYIPARRAIPVLRITRFAVDFV